MPITTREQFDESYRLWASAAAEHDRMMADAMAGKPIDMDLMHQQIAELEQLHEAWMLKSARFVLWKTSHDA